jgi:predicted RNA-binding Zn-ribbon protein involved in translation (DUF1610 family)
MPDDLITLWRYRDLPEALIARSKLEAEGFDSFLADDNIVRLTWYCSNFVGGVRLRVRENDSRSAFEVLTQEIPATFSAEEVGEEYEQPSCPKCGSRDVGFQALNRGIALMALWLFAVPLPIPKNKWQCEDCGHNWKGEYV